MNLNLFPKTIRDYTAYGDQRCALPLLADAYGFYYNKALFAKAGLKSAPRSLAQLGLREEADPAGRRRHDRGPASTRS